MHKLCNYIDEELEEIERKVERGGKLSGSELEYADTLAHLKKSILTNEAMEESGYSGRYPERYHESYAPKRDRMGRYSRDGFMDELRRVMEKAPDEKHKRAIKRMIEDMESE